MSRSSEGWWSVPEGTLSFNDDYGFLVDSNGPFPDPRSHWQPNGVDGLSRFLDHSAFKWQDNDWQPTPLASALIYELHVGTFTESGTFNSAIEKLDYLKSLGITHIEIMPVNEFSGIHGWGYDGVDLYAPHHHYGTPDDLKALVNQCHKLGLSVILDVVYNHLGPSGNYLTRFGPYFTDAYQTPWGEAVNLDGPHSDEVRRFFIDNALMWLRDYHFDGLRIDAVHAFLDRSAVHFLEQLMRDVEQLETVVGRSLLIIAESDLNDPQIIKHESVGGYGVDAQWNEDFHHAVYTLLSGEDQGYFADFGKVRDLADVLTEGFTYAGRYSKFRKRRHGRSAQGLSGRQFIGFIQNHDQIGNRATGDRIGQALSTQKQKMAAAILLTSPFVPMLFQGEEWASTSPFIYFTSHPDKALGDAVTAGRKEEFAAFGWDPDRIPDPQDLHSFQVSKLNWDEQELPLHEDMLSWYRQLIGIRNLFPDLRYDNLSHVETKFDENDRWLIVRRGSILILLNFSDKTRQVDLMGIGREFRLLMSNIDTYVEENKILLPQFSVAIFASCEAD